ncbi:cupin domain-containing protein [Sphingomonas sp. SUN039]|uniref:cupin domain-containing protein n=1 Tax=Sphingomonas sp. SUN039 TaxID=2937787 RepID=UPI002164C4BD|nr:cupin domain-containing protein [Sphingomonas sp. SUN039]UVO55494.1 cupin domain-containing protein [Sphingomonas sp. SUN039]
MNLSNFDVDTFLRDYWQKKPLLIRGAWDGWANPLDPDELAGLACEEGVESRLITLKRADWRVEAGPLPEERFGRLGKAPYTLLVQAVDHHVPEVAALLDPFRFVPDWRIDDVMVSYASDGGGVGPHFDQYDVFLIQGLGRRRWQIGGVCTDDTPLLPHDDLRLLAAFEPVEEWVLEPGDMLYVPPRVAHNGVAVGADCMTYSVGFRAPARSELIAHFCDHILAELDDDDRYADPGLTAAADPREITAEALDALHAMVLDKLGDRATFARWFGSYVTTPKYDDDADAGGDPADPATRAAFIRDADGTRLEFVNGKCVDGRG